MAMHWTNHSIRIDDAGLFIGSSSIVERWEQPIQEALADAVCVAPFLRVLEVGYGLGMAARQVALSEPRSHWIIEAHPIVAKHARQATRNANNTVVVEGLWESVVPTLGSSSFDGIVFDGYPFDDQSFDGAAESTCRQVGPFLQEAFRLLRSGGRLAFLDFSRHAHVTLEPIASALFSRMTHIRVSVAIPVFCAYASGSVGHVVVLQK